MRTLTALLLFSATVFSATAYGQIVASGSTLTVTTPNAKATFLGADLVGFQNLATSESYLTSPPASSVAGLDTLTSNGQPFASANWTSDGTTASLTLQDSTRTILMTVRIDAASQEIVIHFSGSSTQAGVTRAFWNIDGVDYSVGHLIVPDSSGIVLDRQHSGLGNTLQYPYGWQAQMAVFESAAGSMILYSTDSQYLGKDLSISSRATGTVDLSIVTEAVGPWTTATSVPHVEWRLKAFAGDWRKAAAVYRDWLAANRPHVSSANFPWVANIRTVVQVGSRDFSLLDTLASELTPAKTLLYLVDWRTNGYDQNYPNYTPASDVPSYVAKAHSLGFRVMLHTDLVGVTPSNADFASVSLWQVKNPRDLSLIGWVWDSPPSTANRFAWIDPAASAYRSLFVTRVGAAINALHPDALHLDVSAPMFNDGNGLIEGMNYAQGSVQIHKDLLAAYPNVALGGEGMNDIIYPFNSFAQNWWVGDQSALRGHPIVNYLWNSQGNGNLQMQYYGHLGQPAPSDPSFKTMLALLEREAILPAFAVNGAGDVDLTNVDNARFVHWLQSWQSNGYQPDWNAVDGGTVSYRGAFNTSATAALSDSGTLISLLEGASPGSSPLYRRIYNTSQQTTSDFVPGWPAFDAATIYGLDPAQQYWLDTVARPMTTHVASLAAGVQIGVDTMIAPAFAQVQLAAPPSFDFLGNLGIAKIGTVNGGSDGPLSYGATAVVNSNTAGGVTRQGIFMQPPYMNGKAGDDAFVEWTVPVPAASVFSFSVGVADNAGTCTDGVTFRVFVNGQQAWSQNVLHQGWTDGGVDLSAFGGSAALLRVATDPGPAGNPNCDWATFSNLSLGSLATVKTSVPMSLASGAVASGVAGSGSYANGTVSSVATPGQFVLFTAPGSAITAGSNLTALSFTTWLGNDNQLATRGTIFGSGNLGSASSGGVNKPNSVFGHPPNSGRTILAWTVALPASPALQLGWSAGMGDNSLSSTGVQFSVRVNGTTYWTLFKKNPDGWTSGSLDLSSFKGQNVLIQLVTNSVGQNDFDWGWWSDLVFSAVGTPCSYSLPAGPSVSSASGNGSISVSAGANCPWSGTADSDWIFLPSPAGVGNGRISYRFSANSSAQPRTANVMAGGKAYTITQSGARYQPGDVFPRLADSVNNFGDVSLNTLDLIEVLRMVTNVLPSPPAKCSDRYDAMDLWPLDNGDTRGGDGMINTLDLRALLRRATNVDTSRPMRAPRTACVAGVEAESRRATPQPDVEAEQRRATPQPDVEVERRQAPEREAEAAIVIEGDAIYLEARRPLHLAGLALSLRVDAGAAPRWNGATLTDGGQPGVKAAAWLSEIRLIPGQRLLLGTVLGGAATIAVSANEENGRTVQISLRR